MSVKRQATTDLNHENWDQEDPADHEEMGTFKTAPKEVLEKRVIRTAKRRSHIAPSGEEPKKSVFSGFGGFNKPATTSFDFLANLTNGSKPVNGNSVSSGNLFTSPSISSQPGQLFNTPGSSLPAQPTFGTTIPQTSLPSPSAKPTFGTTSPQPLMSSLPPSKPTFGTTSPQPLMSSLPPSKPTFGSTSPQTTLSSTLTNPTFGTISPQTALQSLPPSKPAFGTTSPQTTLSSPPAKPAFGTTSPQSSLFGDIKSNTSSSSSLFSSKTNSIQDTPFKMPMSTTLSQNPGNNLFAAKNPLSSNNQTVNPTNVSPFSSGSNVTSFKAQQSTEKTGESNPAQKISSATVNNKSEEKKDEKKLRYYGKLKGLNGCVSDWIKKHVEETPLCILTPIFRDYEKHLKEMQDEYYGPEKETPKCQDSNSVKNPVSLPSENTETKTPPVFGTSNTTQEQKSPFALGNQSSFTASTTPSTPFSFGIKGTSAIPSSTPFSLKTTMNTESKPFSFGVGKPFNFAPNTQVQKSEEQSNENEDEPPKVEFTPVVEENSVFDTKCKIFIKKDADFVDNGVGTLYIKKIENSNKHQLLVRANTNLGTVLVNLVLASAIPTQRMGKNNVMMVCIPTPDSKPPPIPMLIRVKTTEEADKLLELLNKYKA